VEAAVTEVGFEDLDGFEVSAALPEPLRQTRYGMCRPGRSGYLDKGIGNHELSVSHSGPIQLIAAEVVCERPFGVRRAF
jgi:hypothetical protein